MKGRKGCVSEEFKAILLFRHDNGTKERGRILLGREVRGEVIREFILGTSVT
jgi:hypothetical protein